MADYEYDIKIAFDDLMHAPNVAEMLTEEQCAYVGRVAKEGYEEDLESRTAGGWDKKSEQAYKLALQVTEQKTFPWQGASNVKFPLITVASMYYAARAYATLIDRSDLVTCGVYGPDPTGEKTARAERIGEHMTWQNIRQDKYWEEAHDKGFLMQAIAGDAFIKRTFDPVARHICTKLVTPANFVINYWSRDLESSPRYTEVFELSDNDIRERELDGRYCQPDRDTGVYGGDGDDDEDDTPKIPKSDDAGEEQRLVSAQNQRQGLIPPPLGHTTPYQTGEQYCWWDFDDDGYAEPYIVTFDIATGYVRRIVARFLPSGVKKTRDGRIQRIDPVCVYYRLPFIPSPDGGFYNLGLGHLLGPINESVNTAINQLFDAGTMATLGGGFFGRGMKNRGGPFTMRPYEFYPIDAPGDDIHKQVMLFPVREPSQTLFELAMFLINYGERIASANEIQVGENPGQNTPAETMRTMNENGSRVYSAIYKRTWRAMGEGYCMQYDLNQLHLPESEDFIRISTGRGAMIQRTDYMGDALEIIPSADPYVISDAQRSQKNLMLLQMANQMPGFNRYKTQLRVLQDMKIPAIDEIMPPPMQQNPQTGQMMPAQDFPPPPPPPQAIQAQAKMMQAQTGQQKQQADMLALKIQLLNEVQESRAKVQELQARASLEIAQSKSEYAEPFIKMIYAEIEAEGARGDRLLKAAEMISTVRENALDRQLERESNAAGGAGNVGAGMATAMPQPSNADVLSLANGATPTGLPQ